MNTNYQVNQFYARERISGYLDAADNHRHAAKAVNRNVPRKKGGWVGNWSRQLIGILARAAGRANPGRIFSPNLDLEKSLFGIERDG